MTPSAQALARIGNGLRRIRLNLPATVPQLAAACLVPASRIEALEAGRECPTLDEIERIEFGVTSLRMDQARQLGHCAGQATRFSRRCTLT